jgi:DNA-binding winged helix-turn-helix (wHTH) protein
MNEELPLGEVAPCAHVVRFGPFELDVRAGELRKRGRKILLQEQPLQILLMLLERPGGVVLREEIRKRLWPDDTFVQFAPSINAAIQRLREALGDSADQPRYVETVARRGYRLLEAVKTAGNGMGERGGSTGLGAFWFIVAGCGNPTRKRTPLDRCPPFCQRERRSRWRLS